MKKLDLIMPLLSFVMAFICYLAVENIMFSVVFFIIFVLYYFLIIRKNFKEYYSLISRVHSCYFFINTFIITLSVKESFEDAYNSGISLDNKSLTLQTNELNNLTVYDRVKYLRSYFNLSIYKMFLNILDLYQDQGGNILTMSDHLISECTRTEKSLTETLSIGYKHLVEYITLWIMSFAILIFIKFSIPDFYQMMLEDTLFTALIFGFFILFLLSTHIFLKSYTNLSIKEDTGS